MNRKALRTLADTHDPDPGTLGKIESVRGIRGVEAV